MGSSAWAVAYMVARSARRFRGRTVLARRGRDDRDRLVPSDRNSSRMSGQAPEFREVIGRRDAQKGAGHADVFVGLPGRERRAVRHGGDGVGSTTLLPAGLRRTFGSPPRCDHADAVISIPLVQKIRQVTNLTRYQVTVTAFSGLDVSGELITLQYPLPGCARIIAKGGPLKIVALGSSSTAGAYASSPAASYPARLEIELGLRFPGNGIKVLNRGENGEDVAENLARFDKSVSAEHPNLVLWQVGTNWLMQDRALEEFNNLVIEGLTRIQSTGAEAILIDTQYSPELISKPNFQSLLILLTTIGRQFRVSVFQRFLIMQYWHTNLKIPINIFLSSDDLHMNDWSYCYMAKLLSKGLAGVFLPPRLS